MKKTFGYALATAILIGVVFVGGHFVYDHLQVQKADATSIAPHVTFKDLEQFKK